MINYQCIVIQVEAKSRLASEVKLGDAINEWIIANQTSTIVHWFEPVRKDELYGDYNYNKYHTSVTFVVRRN